MQLVYHLVEATNSETGSKQFYLCETESVASMRALLAAYEYREDMESLIAQRQFLLAMQEEQYGEAWDIWNCHSDQVQIEVHTLSQNVRDDLERMLREIQSDLPQQLAAINQVDLEQEEKQEELEAEIWRQEQMAEGIGIEINSEAFAKGADFPVESNPETPASLTLADYQRQVSEGGPSGGGHSMDPTKPCPECGDLDGCHLPNKIRLAKLRQAHEAADISNAGDG